MPNHFSVKKRGTAVFWLCVIGLGFVLPVGCARVQPDTVTTIGNGLAQVRQQAVLALNDANRLSRDAAIQAILDSPKPGLSEDRLLPAVNPDDINKWDNAFAGMQTYVSALQSLLARNRSTEFGDAVVDLGKELKEGHAKTALPPGLATAFTQIGEILIQAKQQHDAMATMQKADPGIRIVLTSMAAAIGEDPRGKTSANIRNSGLMGTAYTNWQALMKTSIDKFADATGQKNDAARASALDAYIDMLDRRDAQLDALLGLSQSLRSLADAHSAAARGSKVDAAGAIATISAQLDETKRLFGKFTEIKKEKK
jgi:hypothetical protein